MAIVSDFCVNHSNINKSDQRVFVFSTPPITFLFSRAFIVEMLMMCLSFASLCEDPGVNFIQRQGPIAMEYSFILWDGSNNDAS
jgi:hypothetical protein